MMLLVGNGLLITRDDQGTMLPDGCVVLEDHLIKEIGTTAEMKYKYPTARFIDAAGRLIMPGLINSHMHLYSTFARGMALKDQPPGNFRQILERLWWRLDKVLTLEDVYFSAMMPMIDCIKNGTTTIFDHHASPGAVSGSLERIKAAAKVTGLRTCLCYEVSDRDGQVIADAGVAENQSFMASCAEEDDGMIKGMFGLHASFTLSDQTLEKCVQANEGSGAGFHIHAAEGMADVLETMARSGRRVIERLNDFGILGPQTIAAHCVHVNEAEIDLLRESGTFVVHNPESNMGNAVGAAPVLEMMAKGIPVGLGTDGYTTDMFESYKVANLLQKFHHGDPSAGWTEVPAMLFRHNPAFAAAYFPKSLGQLVPGAYGDLIIVDYQPPTPLDGGNINGHLLFGVSGGAVRTTIINGQVLMEEGRLLQVDEREITAKSRELAAQLWRRF